MSPGYSKRSLPEKLGIKPGAHVGLSGAPRGYARTLQALLVGPARARIVEPVRGKCDLVHAFVTSRAALAKSFRKLASHIDHDGALWISWPKKASGVACDLTEDGVRAIGIASGLVDVKVCAVDDTWSGLKFVYRLADRPPKPRQKR
jgi:hypothetical protein